MKAQFTVSLRDSFVHDFFFYATGITELLSVVSELSLRCDTFVDFIMLGNKLSIWPTIVARQRYISMITINRTRYSITNS